FYVTIQYWGVCNPYPTAEPVEETLDYIEIVSIPPAPVTTTQLPVCNGVTPSNFAITTTGIADGAVVNWYTSAVAATPFATGTITANASSLAISSVPGYPGNTVAAVYTVYASYISAPGGTSCESPRTAVTRTIRENLTTVQSGLQITSTGVQCAGATNVQYIIKTN